MYDTTFRNGIIVTPDGEFRGAVAVSEGRIAWLGADSDVPRAKRAVDLEGRVLLPGLFDPHVHLGMGGSIGDDTMLEDFKENSRDFLVGGVTTCASTTIPRGPASIDESFDRAIAVAKGNSWCDYKFTSIPSFPSHVQELDGIVAKGGRDFKFFAGFAGDQAADMGYNPEGVPLDLFFESCEALARTHSGAFVKIHAEEPLTRGVMVDRLRSLGREDHLVAWAESSPEWSESAQLFTYSMVTSQFGLPIYPVHVSSAHTVQTIRDLKARGVNIVAETVIAFLLATAEEMDMAGMASFAKIQPPIRFARDREALWDGLKDGTISLIGTDSLTYTAKDRGGRDFWDCRVGLHLQAADTLSLFFDEGVRKRGLSLNLLVKALSENAARLYGLFPRKGAIVVGADADLVVFDPNAEVVLGRNRYRGHTDYSIWEGREVRGCPVETYLRGQLTMSEGELVGSSPSGRHLDGRWGHP